tara:strand:+ start:21570 stop:23273 length:1704 start_codon:yes stop_codon:yes gene_type:complete
MNNVDVRLVKRFMELFRGRTDWYGHRDFTSGNTWSEGGRDEHGHLIKQESGGIVKPPPLDEHNYHDHLSGRKGLRIIPITPDGNVWMACIDIDKDDIDHVELAKRIESFGFPMYVFVSKSHAAHVYIFFDGSGKPADVVIKKLQEYAIALGCERDLPKAEIFPVQASVDGDSQGNAINLPLFDSEDPIVGKMVDAQGNYYGLEDALNKIEVWSSKRKLPVPLRTVGFADGPPCLETLHEKGGFGTGMRNKGMYNVGVFMKKAYPEDWEERLEAYNRKFLAKPLTADEIRTIIKSLKKKDYQFKCSEDPIASVCEKAVCKTRLYGIKTQEERIAAEAERIPLPISELKKYNTEPPEYAMKVNEARVRIMTAELMNYNKLRLHLLAAMNLVPPMMTQKHWESKLNVLMATMEFVDVSEDCGNYKLALDMIDNLVQHGRHLDLALINHDCWLDWQEAMMGSYAYLTMPGLNIHLINMKNPIEVPKLAILLHQTDWEQVTIRIKGKSTRVWRAFYPGLIAKDHPQSKESKDEERNSRGIVTDVPGQEATDTSTVSETSPMHTDDDQQDHQE